MKPLYSLFLLISLLLFSACSRTPEDLARRGIEALNGGDAGKAAKSFVKAAEKSEANQAASRWAYAGLAAARAGKNGDAEVYFGNALRINENLFEANYNLATVLIAQDRLDEAEIYLLKAVESAPERTEALEVLAGIALDKKDFDTATEYINRARNREENARNLNALAVAVAGKRQFSVDETRTLLLRAVDMDPSYAPAQLNLASILDQNRLDPAQAITHYENFIRLDPENIKIPLIQLRLQVVEKRQASGDYAQSDPVRIEVEALLSQATDAAAQNEEALALQFCLRANAAATRAQRSDLRERALRAATTLVPDSARAHFGLGQFMLAQNRKTEALVSFERAQNLAPTWSMTLRPSVSLAVELNQKILADKILKNTEKAGATNPDLLLEVGDLYAEVLNNPRESRRIYNALIENFPAHENLSEVRSRLNQ